MKKIWGRIYDYFAVIDGSALWDSFKEVVALTFLALLPLLVNLVGAWLDLKSFSDALRAKIIPGEMYAYCLSFLAPSLYLIIKTHEKKYRLPFLEWFWALTLLIYVISCYIVLVAKNKYVKGINMEPHPIDHYLKLSLIFVVTAIIFRVYSVYHGKKSSTYSEDIKRKDDEFVEDFSKILDENKDGQ